MCVFNKVCNIGIHYLDNQIRFVPIEADVGQGELSIILQKYVKLVDTHSFITYWLICGKSSYEKVVSPVYAVFCGFLYMNLIARCIST